MAPRSKVCSRCRQAKPISKNIKKCGFYQATKSADGFQPYCKECSKAAAAASHKRRRLTAREIEREALAEVAEVLRPVPSKACTRCELTKPYEAFAKCAKRADGLQIWCRACTREVNRANYYAKTGRAPEAAPVFVEVPMRFEPGPAAEVEPVTQEGQGQREGVMPSVGQEPAPVPVTQEPGPAPVPLLRSRLVDDRPIPLNRLQFEDSWAEPAPQGQPDLAQLSAFLGSQLESAMAEIHRLRDEVELRDLMLEEAEGNIATLKGEFDELQTRLATVMATTAIAVAAQNAETVNGIAEAIETPPPPPAPREEAHIGPDDDDDDDEEAPDLDRAMTLLGAEARELEAEAEAEEREPWMDEWEAIGRREVPEKLKDAVIEGARMLSKDGAKRENAVQVMVDATQSVIRLLPGDVVNQARAIKAIARMLIDPLNAGERLKHKIEGSVGFKMRAGKIRIVYYLDMAGRPVVRSIGYRDAVYKQAFGGYAG